MVTKLLVKVPVNISDDTLINFGLEHFSGAYWWASKPQYETLELWWGSPLETTACVSNGSIFLNSGRIVSQEQLWSLLY